jgi:chromosome segregation ATPase
MMGIAVGAAALMGVLVPAFAASTKGRFGEAGYASQAVPAPKNEDVLSALLAEVKGLRAAMEQMASAGPRVQLFVSRLQLQEGRMSAMIRRLDSIREKVSEEQSVLARVQDDLKGMEASLAAGPIDANLRAELPHIITQRKREAATRQTAVARLTAEEAQLAQELAVEQGRWTDINQRLDELERALTKR